MYKEISFRGVELENGLSIRFDNIQIEIPFVVDNISKYNVQIISKFGIEDEGINAEIFGNCIFENSNLYNKQFAEISFNNLEFAIKNEILSKNAVDVSCSIYIMSPVNQYDVLNAIPLPVNILTIFLEILETNFANPGAKYSKIDRYFDAYSHLGFCLVDIVKMNAALNLEYENKQNLDLITAFAETEIIDDLFEQGVIAVAWGFNPYTYPIYSLKNDANLLQIFGEIYGDNCSGIYKIDQSINELSVIPGTALRNWNTYDDKSWPKIKLFGTENKLILEPRKLIDFESGETTIVSFLLFREEAHNFQTVPLLNMDLLYS